MNAKLEWRDRFNTGVDFIDKDHKKLFSIMKRLLNMSKEEENRQWICNEGIKYFKNHVEEHFTREEEYMQSISYEGYTMHKRLHDTFKNMTLPELENELVKTNCSLDSVRHFLGVCIGWMTAHTLTEDCEIVGKTIGRRKSKWTNLPPEEVINAIEHSITGALNKMFRLDTRVVSDQYGGEDFGTSLYYRLSYSTDKGQKRDVILIYEEEFLINTVGQLLQIRFNKIDDLIINAARYISIQFMATVIADFPTIGLVEMEKESLLTYDQFINIFDMQTPEYSLLFNTGEGYFGFCLLTTDASVDELDITITSKTATSKIKNYLDKVQSPKKSQILVVDDSDVVTHAMKMLLGSDYDVVLANSATAAFKCIGRSKPDMILLDYDMPVCDGRQTLEMIRSDEEMADIPVVFLTGKADKESVNNVKALKPAGYLLKTMKNEDIKMVIDGLFETINNAPEI